MIHFVSLKVLIEAHTTKCSSQLFLSGLLLKKRTKLTLLRVVRMDWVQGIHSDLHRDSSWWVWSSHISFSCSHSAVRSRTWWCLHVSWNRRGGIVWKNAVTRHVREKRQSAKPILHKSVWIKVEINKHLIHRDYGHILPCWRRLRVYAWCEFNSVAMLRGHGEGKGIWPGFAPGWLKHKMQKPHKKSLRKERKKGKEKKTKEKKREKKGPCVCKEVKKGLAQNTLHPSSVFDFVVSHKSVAGKALSSLRVVFIFGATRVFLCKSSWSLLVFKCV